MVATSDDSDEETLNEEESHQVSNLALMTIREELDEVNDLPSYDELFETFTILHNYIKIIKMKIASLKKKNVDLSNKNNTLNQRSSA